MIFKDKNELFRQKWLCDELSALPNGLRILDAGAGELQNKKYCTHLNYVSQDFCQYDGKGNDKGLQTKQWDTSHIDITSDITSIPEADGSFDVILCSEVFEHIPEPSQALKEFSRLLKKGGRLILTAPFASLVHFAPYHYCTGFSRYWYEYHLPQYNLQITKLTANGDWFAYFYQELYRLGAVERQNGSCTWPLAYAFFLLGAIYFKIRPKYKAEELACFGYNCIAEKE